MFSWLSGARAGSPGHPLYAPSVQGAGRIDNPGRYRTLYVSDSAAGAVGEAFGNHATWTDLLLGGRPDMPGSARALATFDAGEIGALNLDDARALLRRRLRPSVIVSRDRTITQRWALAAFEEKRWTGLRWWSRHEPQWGSFGLWSTTALRVRDVTRLDRDHPAVREASAILARPWKELS